MFCSARQKSCPIVSVRPSETHVSHLHARIHLSASITAAPNIYSSHSSPCLSSGWIGADRLTTEIPKTLSLYPCPCFVAFSKLSSVIDSVSSTTFSTIRWALLLTNRPAESSSWWFGPIQQVTFIYKRCKSVFSSLGQ